MNGSWSQSARGKREVATIGLVAASFLMVPLTVKELYPFSAATMFAVNTRELTSYQVCDQNNRQLPNGWFGLARGPNIFDPPVNTLGRFGFGRRSYPNIFQQSEPERYGKTATEAEVRQIVLDGLKNHIDLPYVVVTQAVYGNNENQVGILNRNTWKVENPYHR